MSEEYIQLKKSNLPSNILGLLFSIIPFIKLGDFLVEHQY